VDAAAIAEFEDISLRTTTHGDLASVLLMEQAPDNAEWVEQWSEDKHREAMDNSDNAHWIVQGQPDDRLIGYVILAGLKNPARSLEFTRIVIGEKGGGYGKKTLKLVARVAFEQCGAHRLWLDVMEHNHRARHVYQIVGFVEEGTLRECMIVDGRFVSLVVMSLLDHEYRSLYKQE